MRFKDPGKSDLVGSQQYILTRDSTMAPINLIDNICINAFVTKGSYLLQLCVETSTAACEFHRYRVFCRLWALKSAYLERTRFSDRTMMILNTLLWQSENLNCVCFDEFDFGFLSALYEMTS